MQWEPLKQREVNILEYTYVLYTSILIINKNLGSNLNLAYIFLYNINFEIKILPKKCLYIVKKLNTNPKTIIIGHVAQMNSTQKIT